MDWHDQEGHRLRFTPAGVTLKTLNVHSKYNDL